jgi:hypothetical protein
VYELTTIRTTTQPDGHEHIDLIGYMSAHIDEPITIPPERLPLRIAMGESFGVRVDGELVEVVSSPCPVCGAPDQLASKKDTRLLQHLLSLPHV